MEDETPEVEELPDGSAIVRMDDGSKGPEGEPDFYENLANVLSSYDLSKLAHKYVELIEKDKEARAIEFYNIMSTLRFVPSTPTLFHAGTPHPQLSSCYLNVVEDDLKHIFKVYSDNAMLSKWAGGLRPCQTAQSCVSPPCSPAPRPFS